MRKGENVPSCVIKNQVSYFSTKTYVVGTQKHSDHLNETVEHPQHTFKLMDKKNDLNNYTQKVCKSGPMGYFVIFLLFFSFIKWNFTKFLIDKNGVPVKRYAPNVEPLVCIYSIDLLSLQ